MQWMSRTFHLPESTPSMYSRRVSKRTRPDFSKAAEYDNLGQIIFTQRFCTRWISLDSLLANPGCQTAHAYSETDLTTEQ